MPATVEDLQLVNDTGDEDDVTTDPTVSGYVVDADGNPLPPTT